MKSTFVHRHRVAFHETDAMAVVHHSNHIKLFESARVEFMRDRGLLELHHPYGPLVFAVVELQTRYLRPARFDDLLECWVQCRLEGVKVHFRYAIWDPRLEAMIAEGNTILVPVTEDLRPTRLPASAREALANEPWTEGWPVPPPA